MGFAHLRSFYMASASTTKQAFYRRWNSISEGEPESSEYDHGKAVILVFASLSLAAPEPSPEYGGLIRGDDQPLEDGLQTRLPAYRLKLISIHAAFAAVAWLFLAPAAVIIARFFKSAGIGKRRRWFSIHFVLQLGTVSFMIVAFVTGYYAVTPGSPYQFKNPHFQIGTAAFAAVLAQALLGILNHFILRPRRMQMRMPPQAQYPFRTPFTNRLHILLGWSVLGLGIANVPIGMVLKGTKNIELILLGVYIGLLLLVVFILEAVRGRDRDVVKEDERGQSMESVLTTSVSSESVLPVAGGRIIEELLYIPVDDDSFTDLRRALDATQVPDTTEASGHGREHGREKLVTASRSETELARHTSEGPVLKETSRGRPIINPSGEKYPAGEVAEHIDGTEEQQRKGRGSSKGVVWV
ncbi:hypothetical protein Dda_0621 [Drechslerella dactyloides]|uniref:Cytochrome b561 domain-containing protein n=1 Tax=Drechslerella dactyloides TaxID=74499 RepID=A0AAD6NNJ8_DREDA|nr:hypothetical protein Dda_0621 [Drechslerella dactyloides]